MIVFGTSTLKGKCSAFGDFGFHLGPFHPDLCGIKHSLKATLSCLWVWQIKCDCNLAFTPFQLQAAGQGNRDDVNSSQFNCNYNWCMGVSNITIEYVQTSQLDVIAGNES